MIQCENLIKIYKTRETEVSALQGLDLTVETGEMIAIIGNSGSGKSTLLNMIGGLDKPSAGTLLVDRMNLIKFTEKDYVKYKLETVGFVWQNISRNLIPYITAIDNVQIPMVINRQKRKRKRAEELLEAVGLRDRMHHRPAELSSGEQQRVAIAIALANKPKLLLADEPTGSVDSKTADQIMDVFRDINKKTGVTIIIVTHDMNLSRKVDRIVTIRDGRTSSEFIRKRSYREELKKVSSYENEELSHVELSIVDSTGRIQLPRKYLDALEVKGKTRMLVEMEGEKITLKTPRDDEDLEEVNGSNIET